MYRRGLGEVVGGWRFYAAGADGPGLNHTDRWVGPTGSVVESSSMRFYAAGTDGPGLNHTDRWLTPDGTVVQYSDPATPALVEGGTAPAAGGIGGKVGLLVAAGFAFALLRRRR